MLDKILSRYGFTTEQSSIEPFGNGLINRTWKIKVDDRFYILQQINTNVFAQPDIIAANISCLKNFLARQHPDYYFVAPVAALDGNEMPSIDHDYFRLFPFVNGSHSVDVVTTSGQAFEASAQFGKFTRLLRELDIHKLQATIPGFHDLSLRYRQYSDALANADENRLKEWRDMANIINERLNILRTYESLCSGMQFPLRVIHHDTKINNVLFDKNDKGLCVIDLDTVMPGYFISDLGDMMRTYLSPVSEEETNFDLIQVRDDFFKAVMEGYLGEMKTSLTSIEKEHIFYSGQYMMFMQALRFGADYLSNDRYYGSTYAGQNLMRAKNQLTLLKRFSEKRSTLEKFI